MIAVKRNSKCVQRLSLLGIFLSLLAGTSVKAWDWPLSAERYRKLDVFERAQYDKARKLLTESQYRAAANEFEKHKLQFPESPILPYLIFMHAYSLHQGKDRNEAIKGYNDVLDYFGEEVEDAAPALYFLGVAQLENGDARDGLAAMKEMVEDVDYQKHELVSGALRRLGDNAWRNGDKAQALQYWKRAYRQNPSLGSGDVAAARDSAMAVLIRDGKFSEIEQSLNAEGGNDQHRHWIVCRTWDMAYWGLRNGGWGEYTGAPAAKKEEMQKKFWEYFSKRKDWFDKAGQTWNFQVRLLRTVCERYNNRDARQATIKSAINFIKAQDQAKDLWPCYADMLSIMINSFANPQEVQDFIDLASEYIAALKSEEEADAKYAFMIDRLREAGKIGHARHLIGKLHNRVLAAWKEYELLGAEEKWRAAEEQLLEMLKIGDAAHQNKVLNALAWVYKDKLHDYDKAIKRYVEIADPPRTLWEIQECYRRWGKLDDAIRTLTEIENSFPPEASKAAWRKTELFDGNGDSKNAIASARRILKVYPKSGESSRAHQLLEKYGVASGGGVGDQDL